MGTYDTEMVSLSDVPRAAPPLVLAANAIACSYEARDGPRIFCQSSTTPHLSEGRLGTRPVDLTATAPQ